MLYFEDSVDEPKRRILSRAENLSEHNPGFERLFTEGELPARVGELLGEPAVLFKDKMNFKLPGAKGFAPHQDVQAGWSSYADYYMTALVTIDPATTDNGCLEIVAGEHRRGMIGDIWQPLTDEHMTDMTFVPFLAAPCDVMFFDSLVPHRSGPNTTPLARRALYITYNRVSAGDQRGRYYRDKRQSYPPDCERDTAKQYVVRV